MLEILTIYSMAVMGIYLIDTHPVISAIMIILAVLNGLRIEREE